MKTSVNIKNNNYMIDFSKGNDISIPYDFDNGNQPNFYNVPKGTKTPLTIGKQEFDVTRKMGCNVYVYNYNIQCTGTHTECVGHISSQKVYVNTLIPHELIPTYLITVKPIVHHNTLDSYHANLTEDDLVISKDLLYEILNKIDTDLYTGLIIRTHPNSLDKKTQHYQNKRAPFLTNDAMYYINELNINYLFVDLPSIDRDDDGGKLFNHKIFWNFDEQSKKYSHKLITEMIFVNNTIKDGPFLLNLKTPNFMVDAIPSSPILYTIL